MLPAHPLLRWSDLSSRPHGVSFQELVAAAGVRTYYSARAALFQLSIALRRSGRSTILLPAFHCPSLVEPLIRGGMVPRFYRVDRGLQIDLDDVRAQLRHRTDAILFINYFGLPSRFEPLLPDLRAHSIFTIEDCAHSFLQYPPLSLAGGRADAAVYSFKKLVPSQSGGGLWLRDTVLPDLPEAHAVPLGNSLRRAVGMLDQLASQVDGGSPAATTWMAFRNLVRRLRGPGPSGVSRSSGQGVPDHGFVPDLAQSRLPWLDMQVLQRASLEDIAVRRQENFSAYSEGLVETTWCRKLVATMPHAVCPWAYPCVVRDRCNHDVRLRQLGIPVWTFGNVLHPRMYESTAGAARADAQWLADNVLCMPVHQGISPEQCRAHVGLVNAYFTEV